MSTTLEEQKNIERILADNFDRFINYANNTFVKKDEFAHLEKEQVQIKIDIEVIKQTMATKADLAEIKTEMLKMKTEILKWTIPFFITVMLSNLGFILAVIFKG